jgi:hypothetical protein
VANGIWHNQDIQGYNRNLGDMGVQSPQSNFYPNYAMHVENYVGPILWPKKDPFSGLNGSMVILLHKL